MLPPFGSVIVLAIPYISDGASPSRKELAANSLAQKYLHENKYRTAPLVSGCDPALHAQWRQAVREPCATSGLTCYEGLDAEAVNAI